MNVQERIAPVQLAPLRDPRSFWTPRALLEAGVRPGDVESFKPREWAALMRELARREQERQEGLSGPPA